MFINKIFKTMISVFLSIIVLCSFVSFATDYESETISSTYNILTSKLSISAQMNITSKKFMNIVIAPDIDDTLTDTYIENNDNVILRTVQFDNSGNAKTNIILPATVPCGRYVYYIAIDGKMEKHVLPKLDIASLKECVVSVDSAILQSDENKLAELLASKTVEIFLDDGRYKDRQYLASIICELRPENGYDENTFVNSYLIAEGLYYVKAKRLTISEFLMIYTQYLGDDYFITYNKLTDSEKDGMQIAFDNNLVKDSFDKTFNTDLFIAKYIGSTSSYELQETVLDYFMANGMSLSSYDAINNDVYKDAVFANMYKSKSNIRVVDDIIKLFNDQVAIQTVNAKNSGVSISGGGSSGGGSSKPLIGTTGINEDDYKDPAVEVFNDINSHWAKESIESMYKKGIINGFEDGSFKPEQNVTRAEFAKMISKVLELEYGDNSKFIDVTDDKWYMGYVAALETIDVVKGDGEKFNPEKNITREDAAVMLYRILLHWGKSIDIKTCGFADENTIDGYATDAVNGLTGIGIVSGYNGIFALMNNTTRAEAAVLLSRMLDYIK